MATKNTPKNEPVVDLDLDLSVAQRKKIRIDGDNTRIIELNLSDMLLIPRLQKEYGKLVEYVTQYQNLDLEEDDLSDEGLEKLSNSLTDIDTKMRECVDKIFDYPVSAKCAPSGSMFDMYNGQFLFEHIIQALLGYYEANVKSEYLKLRDRVNGRAAKYTKKRTKR